MLFGRRVVLEVKSLEQDTSGKVEKEIDPLREREDFPLFYGKVALHKVLRHLHDGREINDRLLKRATRSVTDLHSRRPIPHPHAPTAPHAVQKSHPSLRMTV